MELQIVQLLVTKWNALTKSYVDVKMFTVEQQPYASEPKIHPSFAKYDTH